MKKIILWVVGIFFVLVAIGSINSSKPAVQGIHTLAPTVEVQATPTEIPTMTPIPTIPIYTPAPTRTPEPTIYAPSANICNGTAICGDGSCSYSAHRQGTCSHHGGVAEWL